MICPYSLEKTLFKNFPCIYFLFDGDELVYVGQSVALFYRIHTHTYDKKFDSYSYIYCEKENLFSLEKQYINFYKPKYNFCLDLFSRRNISKGKKTEEIIELTQSQYERFTKAFKKTNIRKEEDFVIKLLNQALIARGF